MGALPKVVEIAPDGSGGAYIVWTNDAGYPLLQHVQSNGITLPNGYIALASEFATDIAITPDGSGRALVATAVTEDTGDEIYVHRVNGSGTVDWTTDVADGSSPDIASDGAGGAIVVWRKSDGSLWAQRISGAGSPQWGAGNSLATGGVTVPRVVADGSSGAVIAFRRSNDLYAVRVNSSGSLVSGWTAGGVVVTSASNLQAEQRLVSDGSGGAVITWTDYRNDPTSHVGDIYALRLDGSGSIVTGWTLNGSGVCTEAGNQAHPVIVADGLKGAVISWEDDRGIYAQRMLAFGSKDAGFPADGAALCSAAGPQRAPALALSASGAVIAAWEDGRTSPDGNTSNAVFAQQKTFDTFQGRIRDSGVSIVGSDY